MSKSSGSENEELIFVALHIHSKYSACGESRLEDIACYCRTHGIKAIAVTDHDRIDGAVKLREDAPDLQVIIGEEITTAEGEVIGLFLNDRIEPGKTLRETCSIIKSQRGLVYVPHPFDRFKSRRIRMNKLVDNLDIIDIIEVHNAKAAFPRYNLRAARFAREHGIVGAVGSDAHYIKAIGSAINVMKPFDGAQDFLEKISRAQFKTGAASLMATLWVRVRKLAGVS